MEVTAGYRALYTVHCRYRGTIGVRCNVLTVRFPPGIIITSDKIWVF